MPKNKIKFAELSQEIIQNYKLNGQLGSLRGTVGPSLRLSETFKDVPIAKVVSSDFFLKHVPRVLSLYPTRNLNADRRHFVRVLNLSFERGLSKYPPRKIRQPSAPSDIGKELTRNEIRKLIANASPDIRLQIEISLSCGARKNEILRLKRSYFDFQSRMVSLPASVTKTRRGRRFALPFAVIKQCEERFNRNLDSEYLFPSPKNPNKPVENNKRGWKSALKRAGIECRFHDLRHTAASIKVRANIPEPIILAEMGLSQFVLRRIYMKTNSSDYTNSCDETWKSFAG